MRGNLFRGNPLGVLIMCLVLLFAPFIFVAMLIAMIPFWLIVIAGVLVLVYCVHRLYDMTYVQELKWKKAFSHMGKPVIVEMTHGEMEGILVGVNKETTFAYSVQMSDKVYLFSSVNYKEG
jgi:hypothetical protein